MDALEVESVRSRAEALFSTTDPEEKGDEVLLFFWYLTERLGYTPGYAFRVAARRVANGEEFAKMGEARNCCILRGMRPNGPTYRPFQRKELANIGTDPTAENDAAMDRRELPIIHQRIIALLLEGYLVKEMRAKLGLSVRAWHHCQRYLKERLYRDGNT